MTVDPLAIYSAALSTALAIWDIRRTFANRAQKKREKHLAEIKKQVLKPVADYLHEHVLPILRHEVGNVDVCWKKRTKPTELTESWHEPAICKCEVAAPLQNFAMGGNTPPIPPEPCGRLVDDARKHHFNGLFRDWDEVIQAFKRYNEKCLQYAKKVREKILECSGLPEFTQEPGASHSEWVNAKALAVYVFHKQIGRPMENIYPRNPGRHPIEWTYGGLCTVAKASEVAWVRVSACVERLLQPDDEVRELKQEAESLAQKAKEVENRIQEELLTSDLRGRCRYV